MEIVVSENLIKLANELSKPLYIVGGRVRDEILGLKNDDVDICSASKPDEVESVCKKLKFKCDVINKRLGTILIRPNNEEHFEFTTFRKETYTKGHTPSEVDFVDDISVDASRRDFTVNSIYYNILTKEIFDPYNGILDLKKKLIRCVETPEKVFKDDGVRILRMVRFACSLGFEIEKRTFKIAKEMTFNLRDISAERKKKELEQIVVAEKKYGLKKNDFIKYFNKLNIYKNFWLLPCEKYKIRQNKDVEKFFKLEADKRFVGFMVLFLLNKYNYEEMPTSLVIGDVQNIVGLALRASNEEQHNVLSCMLVLQELMYKPLNNFSAVNYQKLTDFEKLVVNEFVDVKPVSMLLVSMINNGIPVNESKLNISNEDIINLIGENYISKIKRFLLQACLLGQVENENSKLIQFVKERVLGENKKD